MLLKGKIFFNLNKYISFTQKTVISWLNLYNKYLLDFMFSSCFQLCCCHAGSGELGHNLRSSSGLLFLKINSKWRVKTKTIQLFVSWFTEICSHFWNWCLPKCCTDCIPFLWWEHNMEVTSSNIWILWYFCEMTHGETHFKQPNDLFTS